MTKEELYNLIAERMVQPKNPISVLSQGARPNLPHFTRGEAQLYEVMGRRTKVQSGHTWRTQPVELSKCPSSITSLAHGAKLSMGQLNYIFAISQKRNLLRFFEELDSKEKTSTD